MASVGTHPRPLPISHPQSAAMDNNRPRSAILATVASFSTKLGQVAPRPVPDPPEPVIARAPNLKLEISHQIDRFVQQLRDDFPAHCKEIFVGYYTINDYFDAYDIQRLGEKYLNSALGRIATHNSTAVQSFVREWCPHNPQKVQNICHGTTLRDLFSNAEIRERGELFLTIAVISIRNALESTARKQGARAKNSAHAMSKPGEEVIVKQEVAMPHTEPSRVDQSQVSKVAPSLLRVGWRQPHQPTTAQVDIAQPVGTLSPASVAAPSGSIAQPHASLHRSSQTSASVPVTPSLPQQSPYSTSRPKPSKSTPRVQSYHPSVGVVPPTHQKTHSTPRMSAMTPGFVPQGSMCAPALGGAMQGPPSQTVTPQGISAQLYYPSASFQRAPHGFDAGAMQRELNPFVGYPGPLDMHSNSPDTPMVQPMSTSTFASPPMVPSTLGNMTNLQYGDPMQNMRSRGMSGLGSRQDFGPRSLNKQFGKGSRGGRRNSVRGNHIGGNFRAPIAGQPGLHKDYPFQSMLSAGNTEPFPAFMPPVETSRPSETGALPTNNWVSRPSVWVHGINNGLGVEGATKELKAYFERLLNRHVVDVKVNRDKNHDLYAHVNMANFYDANVALGLDGSDFHGSRLMVKLPQKERNRQERLAQQTSVVYDPTRGYPLPTPLHFVQTPTSQHTVPCIQNEPGVMAVPGKPRGPAGTERRASIATNKQRNRGPSRTYEATANNPMSYSPQDARRMQPIEGSTQAGEDIEPVPQGQPAFFTAMPATEELEQRPGSRASSSANSSKRKKRKTIRDKEKTSNRSGSGTTTPEPSKTSSKGRTTPAGIQNAIHSTTKVENNTGLADKKIAAVLERREQEKQQRATSSKDLRSDKPSSDEPSSDEPSSENPSSDKSSSENTAAKEKPSLSQKDGECKTTDQDGDSSFGGAKGEADANDQDLEQSERSNQHILAQENGASSNYGKTKKPISNLRHTKVAVPDITLHTRKQKQGTPSTTSSTRASYAQAAASAKAPIGKPSSTAALNSPLPEREPESRYFTPTEAPSSPSVNPEKALAPNTPRNVTTGKPEDTTPEKDDSFVTVQEEPPSTTDEHEEREDLTEQQNEQTNAENTVSSDNADARTTLLAEAYEQVEPALPMAALATEQPDSAVQAEEVSASASTAASADVVAHIDPSSLIETKSVAGTAADQTQNSEMGSAAVPEGPEKTISQDTGSIHPLARPKSDRKKQPKKGKSYGKGKKAFIANK